MKHTTPTTRRRFLKSSLAAAGSVVAAPQILRAQARGANDRIGMGFIAREKQNIRHSDIIAFVGGRSGTLGELMFAMQEPKDIAPEFAREWFDTARLGAKRAFTFGNDSLKAFEEFGLDVSETMLRAPVGAK